MIYFGEKFESVATKRQKRKLDGWAVCTLTAAREYEMQLKNQRPA